MADNTKIEWTDASWNPFTGCTRISPGCKNCYMFRQWPRLKGMGVKGYEGEPDQVAFHRDRVFQPLHWKKPKLVFVCSMSDLFHESNTWADLSRVFRVMATTPQHTYQVLTKRPGNMVRFAEKWGQYTSVCPTQTPAWPENVWAGVSVESQDYASRLNTLAKIPAKVRFVSAEPLLGPLDLTKWLVCKYRCRDNGPADGWANVCLWPAEFSPDSPGKHPCPNCNGRGGLLDWVIAGGESGPGARPAHPDWVRSLRDQCREAGIPYFLKQWGEWRPLINEPLTKTYDAIAPDGTLGIEAYNHPDYRLIGKVGKKAAGALLDGKEHREFPSGM